MKIRSKMILGFVIISLAISTVAYVTLSDLNKLVQPITQDLPKTIEKHHEQTALDAKAQFIRYYDEVLTQSARNFAFTEDKRWEERYRDVEPELDRIINEAIDQGNGIEAEFFSSVNDANLALVALEYQSINLVNEGKTDLAIQILESEEYWDQKQIYEQGLRDYVAKRGAAYDDAFITSSDTLDNVVQETRSLIQTTTGTVTIFLPSIVVLAIGISYILFHSVMQPTKNLTEVSKQIAAGNWNKKAKVLGNDEFGTLAKTFNSMLESLKTSQGHQIRILKKYKDLYEQSPGLNRTINLDGIIIDCNQSYADAFGYTRDEIIGMSIFHFVPKEDRADIRHSFETWKRTGTVKSREIIFLRKDHTVFPGILSANNLYDENNKLVGSNTIIQDLSDIRNAQKEIQELRTKRLSVIGELTARIAHDMRNPLSIVKNSAEMIKLEQKDMSSTSLAKWERLERAIYRITHQIEDVLDYVKKPKIRKVEKKFSIILQDSLERVNIPDHIRINLPKKDSSIFSDPERIEIVIVNLIMNAVQAIGSKKGEITISLLENYEDKKYSLIKISDSGPGIAPAMMGKIFDPLFTTRQIGTGLGLPSCRNIIQQHGGTINVNSTGGNGTSFIIKLPTKTESKRISKIGNKEKLTEFITSYGTELKEI